MKKFGLFVLLGWIINFSSLNSANEISRAIIPCAGLGTRMLPLSKSVPKEMVPLLDKPAIEYVVQEGRLSGINEFCIITNENKKAIQNYFSHNIPLEKALEKKGRLHFIKDVNNIIDNSKFDYINQTQPLGLGHAVFMAKDFIEDPFFALLLPDDIIVSEDPGIGQLIKIAKKENASVIAVREVPIENISSYGVISIKSELSNNLFEIKDLVEKPAVSDAPSNLAIVGRYILSSKIFESIEKIIPESKGEIQITDAIDNMLKNGERVLAYKIDGERFDVGTVSGLINATLKLGYSHPAYSEFMKNLVLNS